MKAKIEATRELLVLGKWKEFFPAIEALVPSDSELATEVFILRGMHSEVERAAHRMQIIREEETARLARITREFLEILKKLMLLSQTHKVLFLSANPSGTAKLQLGREAMTIREAINNKLNALDIEFVEYHALRREDIQTIILQEKPSILHFSSHYYKDSKSAKEGSIVEDSHGEPSFLSKELLTHLLAFNIQVLNLKCILLNGCNTKSLATSLQSENCCIIGMDLAVLDTAAIQFSKGFYTGLATGLNIANAFQLGKQQAQLANSSFNIEPVLFGCG